MLPRAAGYGPFRDIAVATEALVARVRGAGAFRDADGTVHVYAGDETSLNELQSDSSWLDMTRLSGGAYACSLTSVWEFQQFGDYVIASNFDDAVQVATMTTGAPFANLGGSPPRAKCMAVFKDFLVLGFTDTSGNEVAWSGLNDIAGWTPGTNQSDRQTLPDGGFVQGFAEVGGTLLVFQQRKIRVMQYFGPPVIMDLSLTLERELGCLERRSICQHGDKVFFLADDGFRMISGLAPSVNIGAEQINEWFFTDVARDQLYRMSAAVDPSRMLAQWAYASRASASGTPDTVLSFYWGGRSPRWSYSRVGAQLLFNALALGYTLEGLDTIAPSLDDFEIPLDDPLLQGGTLRLGAFDTQNRFGVFSGDALEATIETGDFELIPGARAYVSGVRPVVDTDALTVAVAARERAADSAAYTTAGEMEADGMVPLEASGRYLRAKTIIAAGAQWTAAQGLDFEFARDGEI